MASLNLRSALVLVLIFIAVEAAPLHLVEGLSYAGSETQTVPETRSIRRNLLAMDCLGACTVRCSEASKHKPCMKYCQLCCQKCLCVPPGYYGNKETCPCYDQLKNSRGGPKCP